MLVVAEPEQLPVQQARAGSSAAWDVLFRRYQLPLYVYVFELVHEEQTSLDIVQETFINAARHLGSLRDDFSRQKRWSRENGLQRVHASTGKLLQRQTSERGDDLLNSESGS